MAVDEDQKLFEGLEVAKGWSQEGALAVYKGIKKAGIDFVTYVPDSLNFYLQQLVERDKSITSISASREDEGMAIAMGAYMVGRKPAIIMEASGLGLSMLALGWMGIQQQMSLLIFAGHTGILGETEGDSHAVTRFVGVPLLEAMNIPHVTIMHREEAEMIVKGAQITATNHRTPIAIFLPNHVLREGVL